MPALTPTAAASLSRGLGVHLQVRSHTGEIAQVVMQRLRTKIDKFCVVVYFLPHLLIAHVTAGADITEMVDMSLSQNVNDEFPTPLWQGKLSFRLTKS